jgi:hypothetical protein
LEEIVVRHVEFILRPGIQEIELDIDSNGVPDYRLMVYHESNVSRSKAILRVEGVISGLLTNVVHGTLRELNEQQLCDVAYPSVLEAGVLSFNSMVGSELDPDWWMIGDYHHYDHCFGGNCTCPGETVDIEYLPLDKGNKGYLGLRFVRDGQRHYGWMELERSISEEVEYIVRRLSWRRSPGQSILIN